MQGISQLIDRVRRLGGSDVGEGPPPPYKVRAFVAASRRPRAFLDIGNKWAYYFSPWAFSRPSGAVEP